MQPLHAARVHQGVRHGRFVPRLQQLRSHISGAGEKAFYHPELDVLRFFAFLLVFVGHSDYDVLDPAWAAHPLLAKVAFAVHGAGFSGVALFFCLSSYLITELLLREQRRTGRVHFRAFYVRRILRIWPLYFFFLLIVRPLAGMVLPWEHFTAGDYAAFLLLVGNWICMATGWPPSVASPLWSISIEEQFYLAWPLVISRWSDRIPQLAAAMLIVANAMRVIMVLYPLHDTGIWCNTVARLDPFALGAVLAWGLHGRELRLGIVRRLSMMLLAVLLLLCTGLFGDHTNAQALWSYPAEAIACILLLAAVLLPMNSWNPGPMARALIYLGRISYGLYVYHLMMLKFMLQTSLSYWQREPLALACTIFVAAMSYAGLEKPFLRLKQRFTYVKSRL